MMRKLKAIKSKSQRDKHTGKLYRICLKLEKRINEEYEAEKNIIPIKIESGSENEQETAITTTTSTSAPLTSLKMTCSDSEDSFGHAADAGSVSPMLSFFGLQNESSCKEVSPATVMNMFHSVIQHVDKVETTSEHMRKQMECISDRLGRVEKKVSILLAEVDQLKNGMAKNEKCSRMEESNSSSYLKIISTVEELTEFDSKLANEEYYSETKKWLTKQIQLTGRNDPMHVALDLIMDRKFVAQCTWSGIGSIRSGTKISLGKQTNVLKLFRDIGSSKSVILNDSNVEMFFKRKLKNTKRKVSTADVEKPASSKIARTDEPN